PPTPTVSSSPETVPPAGDLLLRQLTQVFIKQIRSSDTLARIGGDEFAVLLPGHDSDQARETAEALRYATTHFRFAWQNQQIAIGISIGVVAVDGKIYQPDDVVTAADAALLMAKENGRDRVVVYQPVTDAG
ncbi:MAG: GGDEF domain-containing protein, partial [Sedimenticolaceae bacterium]